MGERSIGWEPTERLGCARAQFTFDFPTLAARTKTRQGWGAQIRFRRGGCIYAEDAPSRFLLP